MSKALHVVKPPKCNNNKQLNGAITELQKDSIIVILPVDKGNTTVVMDRSEYEDKMKNMLEDMMYKKLKKTQPPAEMERRVAEALKRLETQGHHKCMDFRRSTRRVYPSDL